MGETDIQETTDNCGVLTPGKCQNVTAFSDRTHGATLKHTNHQVSGILAARNSYKTPKRQIFNCWVILNLNRRPMIETKNPSR